jgi:hypothetical protein
MLDAAIASLAKFFRIQSDESSMEETFLCFARGKKNDTMQRAQHVTARNELRRDI